MSADIIPFAAFVPSNGVPIVGRSAPRTRTYGFAEVVTKLELGDADPRTQVKHLRAYAAQAGMPLPRNLRLFGQQVQRGPAAIGRKSVWCAMEFDAWLARGRTPPPVAAALDPTPPLPADRRAALRDRAAQLASA